MRSNSALQWLLPQGWAGLEGGLMVASSEGGTAANGQHKVIGARLGWANKQFGVSAASTRSENNLTVAAGAKFEDHVIGASADFGVARVSLAYRVFDHASAKQKNALVGLWVPLGNGELKASFVLADLDGRVGNTVVDANGARQIGLGYVYNLSRRSAIYTSISRIENKGASTFAVPGGGAATVGGTSSGVEFGMRHNF